VVIDKIQVQQVVFNLVRNSVEALAESEIREIMVTTRWPGGEHVEVCIADTGPGLPDKVLSQLFQPFITTKPKGMGLGLSISRSIIDAHGGRLWAEPNHRGGVTFRFTLPIVYAAE
jgi:two-component system sensor kinase FixL